MNYEYMEMRLKKGGEVVRVYNIDMSADRRTSYATIWRPSQKMWETLKMKYLVPMDYSFEDGTVTSKTEKNKIKEKLTLSHAEWTCTDGATYTDCDEAIEHQRLLED